MQIGAIVVTLHLFCLFVWTSGYLWHRATTKRHKIAVNMVRIEPPPKPAKPVAAAPRPVAQPAAKKTAAAPKPVPKTNKPKPAATPPPKPKPDALLQEIAGNLDAIAAPVTIPATKTEVQIPVLATAQKNTASGSEETIASLLQASLTMPEFGEVRMQLTVDRRGRLRSMEVLHTKSEKNAAFLRNRLPELQFPCLNEDTTLTIVFSNE